MFHEILQLSYSKASKSLYNTWNVAIWKMFELPFRTHRYFIEAISERRHLKFSLLKQEIKFANALRYNKKRTIKSEFSLLEEDTGSIIVKNLHKIMRLCGKSNVRDTTCTDIDGLNYNAVTDGKKWTLNFLKEVINLRDGILFVPEISREEILNILDYVCTS